VGTRKIRSIHRKNAQRLNVIGVNKHTIENGMDFIQIGEMILGLFIKKKEKVKSATKN
jgi:hypothetical protein